MSGFIVSPEAEDDIFQIWCYLVEQAGPSVADRIENELLAAFKDLATMPGIGHRRSDLTAADVRFHALYQYMIVYRRGSPIEFLAVIHGKRDLEGLLSQRL